jgi:NDP-sugar pyrophosphorylase family protein
MKDLLDIDIAILTGGMGTRLKAALPDLPKGLAPVMGRPFLTHLLDRLAVFGVTRTVLCTGYLGDMIQSALGMSYAGIRLAYSLEPTPLDTGGALRLAFPLFHHETIMVLNGDSYVHTDLSVFRSWFRQCGAQAALLLAQASNASCFGRVQLGNDDEIRAFMEKDGESCPGWVNAGIYLFAKSVIESIEPDCRVSLERQIFPAMVGSDLKGYQTQADLLDIGTPESLERAEQFLMGGFASTNHVSL